MKKLTYLLTGIIALSASGAFADDGIKGSFGLLAPQGDATTLTRQIWGGYTYEVGCQFSPDAYGFSLTPYVGWGRMPGKKNLPDRTTSLWGPNTYDLTSWRLGMDFGVQPWKSLPLNVMFGPSLHTWQVDRTGIPGAALGDFSVKLGYRLGLDYAFSSKWSACAYFTQTEWRGLRNVQSFPGYKNDSDTPSYIDGLNPSRPAYFSMMARYTF